MLIKSNVLTVHADFDALGNRGWNPIGGDAQIGAHVQSGNASYLESVALPFVHWKGVCGKGVKISWGNDRG